MKTSWKGVELQVLSIMVMELSPNFEPYKENILFLYNAYA